MTSSPDAPSGRGPAPDADGQTTGRPSRRRRAAPAATALSLLDACGLAPSPAQAGSAAGSHAPAPQPAGKDGTVRAGGRPEGATARSSRAEGTACAGGRTADKGIAGEPGGEAGGTATGKADGKTAAGRQPAARRRKPAAAGGDVSTTASGSVPAPAGKAGRPVADRPADPDRTARAGGTARARRTDKRASTDSAVRADTAGRPGKAGRGAAAVVASGGPLSGPETNSTTPQAIQPAPARGRRSARERAAALAAEADRLAAAYGLSEGGEGLVVLPGDDEEVRAAGPATSVTESLPGGQARPPHAAVTAGRTQDERPPLPQATGIAAPEDAADKESSAASVDMAGSAVRADAADKAGRGPAVVVASVVPLSGPESGSIAPQVSQSAPACIRQRVFAPDGMEDARATVRDARARRDPGLDVPVVNGGPAGMGRREAAFRQWAADMQARFDAGLEAGGRDAGQAPMVVLPPPLESTAGPHGKGKEKNGRSRRGQDGSAAGAAREGGQGPRPRAWKTRRRSTEPGHEARFGDWHGPARTGTILERVFISLGAAPEQAKLNRLWREWAAVLGPDMAPLARPLGHHGDRLLIGAEDALLLQELYYMGPEIVRRVNAFLQEDFFTAVKVSLMLDHQDLDAPGPVAARAAAPAPEPLPAPSGASLGLMDPESAVARCYARFLGLELPDPRR